MNHNVSKVDEVLKRLGVIEAAASDIRSQVSAIVAVLPHLATRSDLRGDVGSVRSEMHRVEASLIRWIVGAQTASVAMASAIAWVIAKS